MTQGTIRFDLSPGRGFAASATAVIAAAVLMSCQSTPRVDMEAAQRAGEATGLITPVRFNTIGPDGGPLDEPDVVGIRLTLTDAVRRAVTTDPGLQAAMARVRIAMADADQARLLPNPVLNVAVRWGAGKPQVEASLAHDFVQALQIPRRASAADNQLRQAAADAVTVAIDVASEVQERYVSAQASSELMPLLRERMTLVDRLTAVAQARLDAGEGTRADLVALQAQRVELQVEIDHAAITEREERLRLARLIGEPSSDASWTLDAWIPSSAGLQTESRWVGAALLHRPEIQSVAWRLKALGDDEAITRILSWEAASVGVDIQRDDKVFAGPSVSTPLPVFDSGQARKARLTAEQIEARNELTLARRKVVEDVRVAYQTTTARNDNLVRIRDELIPLQMKRRMLAETEYRVGQSDITVLLLAEQDLRLARAKMIEVERLAATAMVRLSRAVGGLGVASPLMTSTPQSVSSSSDPAVSAANVSSLSPAPTTTNR